MIKFIAISLSLLYGALLFAPLIPYAEYAMHMEHIILHHCENPDSDCDGVCYLKKQVEHHQTDSAFIVQNIFQILFIEMNEEYSNQSFKNSEFYLPGDENLSKGIIRKLLIPPRV